MTFLLSMLLVLLLSATGLEAQGALPAQRDSTTELFLGVSPTEVTVGDRFQAVVRVDGPDGTRIEYPDITGGDTIQSVAPLRITTTAAGDTVAVYTLVAWIAGQPLQATLPVRLHSAAGVSELDVALRLPTVRSVLPAGDTIVEPRPPKPLIVPPLLGKAQSLWLYLLLAALAAGALGYWLLDRHRRAESAEPGDPRAWAMAQLDLLEASPAKTHEERVGRYQRISRILRLYVARIDPGFGLDLTTPELTQSLHQRSTPEVAASLSRLLDAADKVKFAGARPGQLDADLLLDDARAFVALFPERDATPELLTRAAA